MAGVKSDSGEHQGVGYGALVNHEKAHPPSINHKTSGSSYMQGACHELVNIKWVDLIEFLCGRTEWELSSVADMQEAVCL
jgi:hypothetical protein